MGRWKKGQSGNVKGRPKGSSDTRHLISYIGTDRIKRIIEVMAEQAEQGDTQAASMLINKVISGFKPETAPIEGFELDTTQSIAMQCQQITTAVAAGELNPDQGQILISGLTSQARVLEVSELEQRITKLEAMNE